MYGFVERLMAAAFNALNWLADNDIERDPLISWPELSRMAEGLEANGSHMEIPVAG